MSGPLTMEGDPPNPRSGLHLRAERLSQGFGRTVVLDGIDVEARPGEFLAIVGKSGCGKTTFLRILAGLDSPSAGTIALDGHVQSGPHPEVRMVFQEARLLPWKTVLDNVALGQPGDARAASLAALRHVGLEARAQSFPAHLSGGQQQRVALARALVSEPRMLLLDEPLGALDALTRLEMQALLERLFTELGFTAVLVTHEIQEAVALADRVLVFEHGRVALEIEVDLPRPRARDSAAFVGLSQRVLDRILSGPPASRGGGPPAQPAPEPPSSPADDARVSRRRLGALSLAGVAALVAPPASSLGCARPASTVAAKEIRIGYQKYGSLILAKEQGRIEKALPSLKITWVEFPGGIQMMEAFQGGGLDFGTCGEAPPVFAQAAGADIVYVGVEPPAPRAEAILVRRDSPIRSVGELAGKRFGVNKGSNAHYLLVRALESAGVRYDDVAVLYLTPADARAAFEAGKIDAWSIWDPFFTSEVRATNARILRDGTGIALNPGIYLATRSFAVAEAATLKTILGAIAETDASVAADLGAAAALLAPHLGMDAAVLAGALANGAFGVRPVSKDVVQNQQRVADAFTRLGVIPRSIEVERAVLSLL